MAVDIAKYVEQVVEQVTKDGAILEKFKKDPVKTVADLLGSGYAQGHCLRCGGQAESGRPGRQGQRSAGRTEGNVQIKLHPPEIWLE